MNKTYLTTIGVLSICIPYAGADAARITCTEGGVRVDTYTCTIVPTDNAVTLGNGDSVQCLCSGGTGVRDVLCHAKYEPVDDDGNGFLDDEAELEISSCYIPTCAAGEYYNTDNSYCESCAYFTNCDEENVTSDAGAVGVNECYFPKNVAQSDSTGTFVFTNNCYWDGERQQICGGDEETSSTTTTAA